MRHATFHVVVASLVLLGGIAFSLPAAPAQPGGGQGAANGGGPPGDNDAASGSDAGNSPLEALPLGAPRRTWNANLTPPGADSDWYVLDASSAFCAVVSATANAPGHVTLSTSALLEDRAARPAEPHRATRLAIAGAAGASAYFGLEPPAMRIAAGTATTPGPGRYTFSIEARGYADLDPQNDGESPEAGATVATAAALEGDCLAGRVGASAADMVDAWAFDVAEPRDLTLSFAVARGDAARARVVSPSGATVATLESGDAVDVWADEPGRWTLVVERALAPTLVLANDAAASATDYILGLTEGPPGEPQPCRPTCVG